jgi:hypothetical protein
MMSHFAQDDPHAQISAQASQLCTNFCTRQASFAQFPAQAGQPLHKFQHKLAGHSTNSETSWPGDDLAIPPINFQDRHK